MGSTIVRGEPTTARERRAMVDNQIRTFDVTDQRVQQAFSVIPRELFLPPDYAKLAYSDAALPVGGGPGARRMMLAPMVLARMLQGLQLLETETVLVVAAGTGYAAAIAAELCRTVMALECDETLAAAIRSNAATLGLANIEALAGPLAGGTVGPSLYDAILVCGAVEQDPIELFARLALGGRLVAIQADSHEATRRSGKVTRYDRVGADLSSRVLFDATAPVLVEFRKPAGFVF